MYSLRDYGEMIADTDRFNAYSGAIERGVRPNDVVLEIGCGPGLFALLGSRAGARKVYAIETDDVVEFARGLAAANGLTHRIEFIQGDSRKTELPERVNMIVSDIRGVLPLYDHAIATIEDARKRFLAPGGILIPQRDVVKAALIEASDFYCRLVSPWQTTAGVNTSSAVSLMLNASYSGRFKTEQVISDSVTVAELDYASGAQANVAADLTFRVSRQGCVHGVCVWFEASLLDEIGYSTGPGATNTVYGQMFFPFLEPVPVQREQEIRTRLEANLVGADYVWRWETAFRNEVSGEERTFRQSTFQGAQFSPQSLRRRAADFVPALSESGQADRWLLGAIDGKTSLQEIAQSAAQRFPKVFPRWEDALTRAAELADQFSRR